MTASALAVLVTVVWAQASERTGPIAILDALLFGSEAPTADARLSAETRQSLLTYHQREAQFKPTVTFPGDLNGDLAEDILYRKHVAIERTVFCLFARPDSQRLAHDFAMQIVLSYEWGGMADSPLAEAASADAFLARHRNSPIASYVHLFSGHRKLCAVTGDLAGQTTPGQARSITRAADRDLQVARNSGHPLVREVAQYLLTTRNCVE